MRDPLGRYLASWRNRTVMPYITGKLLDVGCGLNSLVRSYPGEGCGVDVHQWGDVDVLVTDTSKLDFQDGAFQTVTFIACLNHIPNREQVLREAFRLLSPGGKIIITMIPPGISRAWHFLRQPWDDDQTERGMVEGEVYGLRGPEVHGLLEQAGFRVISEQGFMLGINRLTVAIKAANN